MNERLFGGGAYLLTVIIWGTTWYGIKFQLGMTPELWSLAGRYLLAGAILFILSVCQAQGKTTSVYCQLLLLLKGLMMYFLSYSLFYYAIGFIPSGLVAFTVSSVLVFNILNDFLIRGIKYSPLRLMLAFVSLGSLFAVYFSLYFQNFSNIPSKDILYGGGLTLLGAYSFSVGNIISKIIRENCSISFVLDNAYSMVYAGILFLVISIFFNIPLIIDTSATYVFSFLYLTLLGSVVSFYLYIRIIGQFGPATAGYVLVYAPLLALLISIVFEGVHGTFYTYLGMMAVFVASYLSVRYA